jgi:4-amino-4-deoxy-L-arabinose transferase-like glycosyltransferase
MNDKIFLIIVLLTFLLSILIRVATIDRMGRTWDEDPYVEQGYEYISLLKRGDFTNPYWYENPDHPLLARYVYGVATHFDITHKNGKVIFDYDYTYSRFASIIIASLTIPLVMLIGKKYFSPIVGVFSGVILSLLPLSVGYSQLATLESFILFFFTLTVFLFLKVLEEDKFRWQIATGIALGMALMVKQSNALLIPLLTTILFIWRKTSKTQASYWKLINIFGIGFITFFLLWPMPWFHLDYVIDFHNKMWAPEDPQAPPELIFGRFMLTPPFYYLLSLLITTPGVILILFLIGIKNILNKKAISLILLAWLAFPLLQSFYHFRQHNIRYIIEIYAPLSIIAAIGFEKALQHTFFTPTRKAIAMIVIVQYLLLTLYKASPYYLEYFNGLVGGTKNVYNNKLFLLGWWGQGMKEAGEYLEKNAQQGAKIGIAISPYKVFPPLPNQEVEKYNNTRKYDYVVVSYFNVIRENFDDSQVKNEYQHVYSVDADGAKLVDIYKKK